MAARLSAKRLPRYSLQFKQGAVRLTEMPGMEVQVVARALDIHPVMLSRWRQESREGRLRGTSQSLPKRKVAPPREVKRLQELEREHALLQEEHELLKKPFGSVPSESRRLRVHRPGAASDLGEASVRAAGCHARGVLRVAGPPGEWPPEAGPTTTRGHPRSVRTKPRHLWESAHPPFPDASGMGGEPPASRTSHAIRGSTGPSGSDLPRPARAAPAVRKAPQPAMETQRQAAKRDLGR